MYSDNIENRSLQKHEMFPEQDRASSEQDNFKNYSDQQLWSEFSKGSEAAFAHIYSRFFSLLFNYGIKIAPNHQLINDCIQELFIDIWSSRLRLKEVEWLKTYLIKSVRRRIIKELKRENNASTNSIDEDYNFRIQLSHDVQLINQEDKSARIERLNLAMEYLTDRQREAVFLKFYERLSYEQLAGVMGISTKAVYKIMARAVVVLRKAYKG